MSEQSEPAERELAVTVPGRGCDGCTLCCKLLPIEELAKPASAWCPHCDPGRGCRIYADRPSPCRGFYCGWMVNGKVAAHWRPRDSRMVLDFQPTRKRLVLHVDPGRPDAWRKPPYHTDLQAVAGMMAETGGHVLIACGPNFTMLLGRQEFPLGRLLPSDKIVYYRRPGPTGWAYDVTVNPGTADEQHPGSGAVSMGDR